MAFQTQMNQNLSSSIVFRLACQIELKTQQMLSMWDSQPDKLQSNKQAKYQLNVSPGNNSNLNACNDITISVSKILDQTR